MVIQLEYEVIELTSPDEIVSLLLNNDIRLWVAYISDPAYSSDFYEANVTIYDRGSQKEYGVYSFYVTRPFENTRSDIEKLVELISIHIPITSFSHLYVQQFRRIPSGCKHVTPRWYGPSNRRKLIKIFDVDNKVVYVINRKDYHNALKELPEFLFKRLLEKYPDTLTIKANGIPKWVKKISPNMFNE